MQRACRRENRLTAATAHVATNRAPGGGHLRTKILGWEATSVAKPFHGMPRSIFVVLAQLRAESTMRNDSPKVRSKRRIVTVFLAVTLLAAPLAGCGYNTVIERDEEVKAAWAEVENQYKRRADLVPNLVNVVKGNANFEKSTLESVVEARSKVAGMKVDQSVIDDPAKLEQFEKAQQNLSGALSRLLVVVERYPELKATDSYRDLQAQLEGTENRITVARKRYIESVAEYNKVVQLFPSSIGASMRGKSVRPTFTAPAGLEKPPEVKF
jgi:LemA protein